jgi:alpha-tubulin suppressor-like RCC1 family protein
MGRSTPFTALTAGAVPGLTGITSIAAGGYHSLAVRANGTVAAWGYNIWGQVGDGTILDQWTPVTVPGLSGVRSVAAGIGHSLALGTDGTVRSWGLAHVGQLGRLAVLPLLSPSPAVIPGLTGVTKISGGGYHSLALLASGTVVGWGWNAYGQLGDGSLLDRLAPVAVAGLVGVTSISAGVAHDLVAGA